MQPGPVSAAPGAPGEICPSALPHLYRRIMTFVYRADQGGAVSNQ